MVRCHVIRPALSLVCAATKPRLTRLVLCALALGLLALSSVGCAETRDRPVVVDGALDLSSWDFEARGVVPLRGEWEICWNAFVPAESGHCPFGSWESFPVPKLWSDAGISSPIGGRGIASYRATLALPVGARPFSLRVGSPLTAYRLWINGVPVGGVGELGTTAETVVSKLENRDYALPLGVSRIEILVHVANFDFRGGGLRRSWYVGLAEQIVARNSRELLRDASFAATSLVLGAFFLAQFALRSSEQAHGWLGLFAVLLGLRMIPVSYSDLPQLLMGWASFPLLIRLDYASTALLIVAVAAYTRVRVLDVMPPRTTRLLLISALALVPIHLFAPFSIVVATVPAIQGLAGALMFIGLAEYARAYRSGVEGAGATLLAGAAFSIGIIHDVIRSTAGWGASIELFPFFMIVCFAIESFYLLQSRARAYSTIEALSDELQEANFDLRENEEAIVRFVPFDLMNVLGKESIRDVQAGDHARVELSVLHCGFHAAPSLSDITTFPAGMETMNRFIERLEHCGNRHDGFMNDHGGDGIQILFPGGPGDAIAAGLEMLVEARVLIAEIAPKYRPLVNIGIGIDTGSVLIGMTGGRQRLTESVEGGPVDTAQRIEALATVVGSKLLISAATRERLGEQSPFEIRHVDVSGIEGEGNPSELYEVVEDGSTEV